MRSFILAAFVLVGLTWLCFGTAGLIVYGSVSVLGIVYFLGHSVGYDEGRKDAQKERV